MIAPRHSGRQTMRVKFRKTLPQNNTNYNDYCQRLENIDQCRKDTNNTDANFIALLSNYFMIISEINCS